MSLKLSYLLPGCIPLLSKTSKWIKFGQTVRAVSTKTLATSKCNDFIFKEVNFWELEITSCTPFTFFKPNPKPSLECSIFLFPWIHKSFTGTKDSFWHISWNRLQVKDTQQRMSWFDNKLNILVKTSTGISNNDLVDSFIIAFFFPPITISSFVWSPFTAGSLLFT